jgi:hypothetical protein
MMESHTNSGFIYLCKNAEARFEADDAGVEKAQPRQGWTVGASSTHYALLCAGSASPCIRARTVFRACVPAVLITCSHLEVLWLRKPSRAPIMTLTAMDSHAEICCYSGKWPCPMQR